MNTEACQGKNIMFGIHFKIFNRREEGKMRQKS